ncbi:MAG: DUF2232 domain-containing protein [Gammaproteobacteria bacterium]|nr:DUF2232 domain-containing protein [Gammaproteobacteria bacterium]
MLRALGDYILRGRIQAAAAISLLTFTSWFLPPLTYFLSGAPVGLLTLRRGGLIGAQVMTVSLLMISLLVFLVRMDAALGASFAVGVWAPVWLCSLVLRYTESQGLMVLAAAGVGMLFAALMHLLVDDVSGWWRSWFLAWLEANLPAETAQPYQKVLEAAAPWLNAMMASALVASLVVTLLVARWWQAGLFNPGGFRSEFHALRLPRLLALPTALGMVVLGVTGVKALPLVQDLFVILLLTYVFHGIATVHRSIYGRSLSRVWLVALYGLLILVPQLLLFVSCIGMADSLLKKDRPGGSGSGAG